MKITRRRGQLLLRLEPAEVAVLVSLLDELDALLESDGDPDDAVVQRLHPDAYPDDTEAEVEYRSLTETSLRTERSERLEACRAELDSDGAVDLTDPAAGQRWIQVLNDLRLALGTRLGITEDDDHEIDPSAADAHPRLIYYWLTAVQDSVVQHLMH
jgi:Domain of unknown function (DUF2017)